MAAHNSSEAYDFALFEPKRRQAPPQKKENIIEIPREKLEHNRRARVKPAAAVSGFLAFAVIGGIVGTFVYGQVQLTELTDSLNAATKTLNESRSLYTQMKMKSDSQLSLEKIENYATQTLGMQKIDQNQVTPIELSKGDKSEVVRKSGDGGWFSRLTEAVRRLLS